eukprot:jgi/Chlat1/8872/Chrsp92S00686
MLSASGAAEASCVDGSAKWEDELAALSRLAGLQGQKIAELAQLQQQQEQQLVRLRAKLLDSGYEHAGPVCEARLLCKTEEGCPAAIPAVPDAMFPSTAATQIGAGGVLVPRSAPFAAAVRAGFPDYFKMLAAARLPHDITALAQFPHPSRKRRDEPARYLIAGDAAGSVHVMHISRAEVASYGTGASGSDVTAMHAFVSSVNQTTLVTGHQDGQVRVHRVSEQLVQAALEPEDNQYGLEFQFLTPFLPPNPDVALSSQDGASHEQQGQAGISSMLVYRFHHRQYLAAANRNGLITIMNEDGSIAGSIQNTGPVLAFKPSQHVVSFVSSTGVGTVSVPEVQLSSAACSGTNGSTFTVCTSDAVVSSRMYCVGTANKEIGEEAFQLFMLYVSLDQRKLECRARYARPVPFVYETTTTSPAIQVIADYLVVATTGHVAVYNITTGMPRQVLLSSMESLTSWLGEDVRPSQYPLLVTDGQHRVALGFASGLLVVFESQLPRHQPVHFGTKVWSSPLFIAVVVLIVVYQFTRITQRSGHSVVDDLTDIYSAYSGNTSRQRRGSSRVRGSGSTVDPDMRAILEQALRDS